MTKLDTGFTLIEILVTMAIVTFVLASASTLLLGSINFSREAEVRLETNHGLRSATDMLTRDIRLAGACLPSLGTFLPLDGLDNGTVDDLTIRIGVGKDEACVVTTLRQITMTGGTDLDVESLQGFSAPVRVYLIHPNGSGEFVDIQGIDSGAQLLQAVGSVTQDYPIGSGVFALVERAYSITTDVSGDLILSLSVDGEAAEPIALGIEQMDVTYRLRQNCPPCDTVSFPANDAEWRLVTDLSIDLTASFPTRGGQRYSASETIRVRARNLLP